MEKKMKRTQRKVYVLEYLGREESEIIILRDPKSGDVVEYLTDATELANFLRNG